MSDFKYTVGNDTYPVDGGVWFQSQGLEIRFNFKTNTGLDMKEYIEQWVDDANLKLPFRLKATYTPTTGEPIEADMLIDEVERYFSKVIKLKSPFNLMGYFPGMDRTSGEFSMELGLKAQAQERPCGGYEEMIVTKDDNPTCTNSCTFKNTVTNREFKFNNIDLGTYDFRFEGPNERYEIIWGDPEGCDDNRVGIMNRVVGKKLFLEDYGNSPNAEDINFVDLMIEVKYGSYEWAGGDTDTVYYITANNGTLCGPGELCVDGECVDEGVGKVDFDDILLSYSPDDDEVYRVRAGDYQTRYVDVNQMPVTRGAETFKTNLLNCGVEDTDTIPLFRPSDSTTYALTGKDFKNAFCFNRRLPPKITRTLLSYKDNTGTGISGQTFKVEIETPDNGPDVTYKLIPRIIGLTDVARRNLNISIFLIPTDSTLLHLDEGDRSERVAVDLIGDVKANVENSGPFTQGPYENGVFTQPGTGAVMNRNSGTGLGRFNYGWENIGWVEDNFTNAISDYVTITGDPDFDLPFTRVADAGPNQRSGNQSIPTACVAEGFPTALFTFDSPENIPKILQVPEDNEGIFYRLEGSFMNQNNVNQWSPIGWDLSKNQMRGTISTSDAGRYAQEVASIQGLISSKNLYFTYKSHHSNYWFIDASGGTSDKVKDVGKWFDIGDTNSYEFTMSADTKMETGGDAPEDVFQQALLVVDVWARNGVGDSSWVSTNYLTVI